MTAVPEPDPYPSSEFDDWASEYDDDVSGEGFPFTGYRRVLAEVVRQAEVKPGMAVLDLGTGTGNLAEMVLRLGCAVWGTDFSGEMLEKARVKLPQARFILHDLRQPFPAEWTRRFDRVISAYVFHHFDLAEKVAVIERIMNDVLVPGGRLVIADISFPTARELNAVRRAAGDQWDEELYWVADEALPALRGIGAKAAYVQVSGCAGVYRVEW